MTKVGTSLTWVLNLSTCRVTMRVAPSLAVWICQEPWVMVQAEALVKFGGANLLSRCIWFLNFGALSTFTRGPTKGSSSLPLRDPLTNAGG